MLVFFSSGSGKTTVSKLLTRMFDAKKGRVMLGGEVRIMSPNHGSLSISGYP